MLSKSIRFLVTALLIGVFVGQALHYWQIPFLVRLEAYLYDSRLRFNMPNTLDERVVIIDIDEKSLGQLGHWPWGRDVLARLVQELFEKYQIAVLGFDVVLAEPDTTSGIVTLDRLAKSSLKADDVFNKIWPDLKRQLDNDARFAEVIKNYPVVLGFSFNDSAQFSRRQTLPPPVFLSDAYSDKLSLLRKWPGFTGNLEIIQEAAGTGGHFTPKVDPDGIARKVPLFYQYESGAYQALSLGMLRKLFADPPAELIFPDQGVDPEAVSLKLDGPDYRIPVDAESNVLIPYRGEEHSFPYFSAVDVLEGRISEKQLKGKVALLGASARGLLDQRSTPVGNAYPGVEIHANLVAGMLDQNLLSQPRYTLGLEALLLCLFGVSLAWGLVRLNAFQGLGMTLLAVVMALGLSQYLWLSERIVLPLAGLLSLSAMLYLLAMSWGYWIEGRNKRDIANLFGQYVPPELVEKMATEPTKYSMAGRSETLTVLFCDIRGFTTFSERLDPKNLAALLNEYLGEMTVEIQKTSGTLDKYIGDAIMAFWGAPLEDKDHAKHAVTAAIEMQAALGKLNQSFESKSWPTIEIGIGINTGTMVVGDMGSQVRKAYTVLGDAVNLASRLEGLTKYYGVPIIIGEETKNEIPELLCRELDRVKVKGKERAVSIYQPLSQKMDERTNTALLRWDRFLETYRAQKWLEAGVLLAALAKEEGLGVICALYKERIKNFMLSPPPADWDGTVTFESK